VTNYFDDLVLINKKLIGAGSVKDVFRPEKLEEAYQYPFQGLGKVGVGV
jgi:iron/zinc/copper transport system ATP-binding protein